MHLQRAFWIAFIVLTIALDLGAFVWFLYAKSLLLLALVLVLATPPALAWQFLRADLEYVRGEVAGVWAQAGYKAKAPRGWVWIDADGDGEVDEGELQPDATRPRVVTIRGKFKDEAS